MRLFAFIAIGAGLAGGNALAQETAADVSSTTNTTPALTAESDEKAWSFSTSVYTYFVPDDRDYVQPTLTADRGWLHLEARYNYEALDTSSLWIGYNYGVGDKLTLEFTPMLGGVFGATAGIAPGYRGTLSWWKLELYTEGEYLFDTSKFVRQLLLLHMVGIHPGTDGLVSLWPRSPANETLSNGL